MILSVNTAPAQPAKVEAVEVPEPPIRPAAELAEERKRLEASLEELSRELAVQTARAGNTRLSAQAMLSARREVGLILATEEQVRLALDNLREQEIRSKIADLDSKIQALSAPLSQRNPNEVAELNNRMSLLLSGGKVNLTDGDIVQATEIFAKWLRIQRDNDRFSIGAHVHSLEKQELRAELEALKNRARRKATMTTEVFRNGAN